MLRHLAVSAALLSLLSVCGCGTGENKENVAKKTEPDPIVKSGLYFAPASESKKRAEILPTKGSEDAASILEKISIPKQPVAETKEYLPNSAVEWVVHASIGKPLPSKDVDSKFDKAWRTKYGGMTIYGRNTATNHWTFLISADGPNEVDALQFAWQYYENWNEDAELASPSMYEARMAAVKDALGTLTDATVRAEVSPQDAFERAKLLSSFSERFDKGVTVRLAAPKGSRFAGRKVWDVMLSLGLKWGDMDCFHWQNSSGFGDDYFFSVWTSTQPGYFLPEEVAADKVAVEDLLFGYSIPRSADPVAVYDRMMRAVRYTQKRLGGTITSADGQAHNEEATLKEIKSISSELEKLGFSPGSENALRQF